MCQRMQEKHLTKFSVFFTSKVGIEINDQVRAFLKTPEPTIPLNGEKMDFYTIRIK